MNEFEHDWHLVNYTKEMQGAFAVGVRSYFDELDDEEDVCTLFLNDIHINEQVDNALLIKNAPKMFRLLRKIAPTMDEEATVEFNKILEEINDGFAVESKEIESL